MGAEGTSGCASARLSPVSPVFPSLRGGERRGSASRKRSPGPARKRGGSHRAKARGARVSPARWGLATLSALPDRPPLPLQAGKVRGARSAPSAPARPSAPAAPGTRRPGGAHAAEQGRAQELPQAAKALSSAARELLQRRPLSGVGRSCSRAARTWAPAPGPRQRRAGPRHLRASPARRRPARRFPAPRKVPTEIHPRKEGKTKQNKTRNF